MKDTQQKQKEFSALPYDQKYGIVMDMLKKLENDNEKFHDIYEKIQTLTMPSATLLTDIYQELINLSDKERQEKKRLEMESFQKIQQSIEQIKLEEAMENQGDNPENILTSM